MHFLWTVTVMVDEFHSVTKYEFLLAPGSSLCVYSHIRCMCCCPLRGTYAWYASAHTIHGLLCDLFIH
jgi:hypothetical protein